MRSLLLLACCFVGAAASAQDEPPPVRWPAIAQTAREAADFVPRGWALEASRTGDIDGDGIADLVAIVHGRAPTNFLHDGRVGPNDLDTNPRVLVVAKGRRDGSFQLLLANHTLIPRWTEWNLDDPLGDLSGFVVRRGGFSVPLHLFANAGGWGAFERSFTFRFVGGRCLLIGYDEQYLQRNSGVTTTSVNYLSGVKDVQVEGMDDDTPHPAKRTKLPRRALLTIDEVGDGMDFQPR